MWRLTITHRFLDSETVSTHDYYCAQDAAGDIVEHVDMEEYTLDLFNENWDEIEILGKKYKMGDALQVIDEDRFEELIEEQEAALISDIEYELENMDEGEEQNHFDIPVVRIAVEEEEEEE